MGAMRSIVAHTFFIRFSLVRFFILE